MYNRPKLGLSGTQLRIYKSRNNGYSKEGHQFQLASKTEHTTSERRTYTRLRDGNAKQCKSLRNVLWFAVCT